MQRGTFRRLQLIAYAAVPVYAGVVYLMISRRPDDPLSGTDCILIYLGLEVLSLIYYAGCAIGCGDADEHLDPACVGRCFLNYLIVQLILITLLVGCLIASVFL